MTSEIFLYGSFAYIIIGSSILVIAGIGKEGWRKFQSKMKYWYCNVFGHDFSDERLRSFHSVWCKRCMGQLVIEYEKGERFP